MPGKRSTRRGSVVVWLVVCLGVIVGVVALGMDGGRMMEERRRAQAAADAAALAGARDMYGNYGQNQGTDPAGTARSAALASAAANDYANDGTTSTVTVNVPPQSGAFAGRAEHVEVIVTSWIKGSFGAVFTKDPLKVQARAVARGRPHRIGLVLLQSSGSGALQATGNGTIEVVGAPLIVNSPDPAALDTDGNATVSALYSDVAGSVAPGGNILGPVNTSVPPTPDPLASLPAPNPADYPVRAYSQTSCNEPVTLKPGVYQGGISIGGQGAVTLEPGVYILDGGGLSLSGQGSITGLGVMFYNTGGTAAGPIDLSGQGTITLTPPADGPYAGICLFQDRAVSEEISLTGKGTIQIAGTVYAPAAGVRLGGNGSNAGSTIGSGFVVNHMRVSGNGTFTVSQGAGTRPRVPDVGLVE